MKRFILLVTTGAVVLFVHMGRMFGATSAFYFEYQRPYAGRLLTWWMLDALTATGLSSLTAAVLIGALALVVFMVALRWLAEGVNLPLSTEAAGLVVAGLLPLMLRGSQLYDLPTLALFTLALGALAHRHWPVYALAFSLATLNRETAVLLAVVYGFYVGFDYGWLVQVTGFALVRSVIVIAQAGLPGVAFETHWVEHVEFMAPNFELMVVYALTAVGLAVLVRHRFEQKPRLLRVAALTMTPLLLAMYLLVGFPFEFRVLVEAYPALALLALPSMPD